jgi:dTDP-4-amino-4,6-dideoxygalactose transaminase
MKKNKNDHQQKVNIHVGGNVGGNVSVDDHHTKTDSRISHVTAEGDVKIATGGATLTEGSPKDVTQLSRAEVLKLFQEMLKEVDNLEISEESKRAAKKHLKHAALEVEEEEKPNKQSVAEFLKKATEVLKEAGVTAVQAASFGKLVGTAADWLGETLVWFGL